MDALKNLTKEELNKILEQDITEEELDELIDLYLKDLQKDMFFDDKVKVYLGCDLFTEGQRLQAVTIENELKRVMGDKVDIYNPASNLDINDKSQFASGSQILMADYDRLKESDVLIALLDTMDSGLCAEMGMAWVLDIPIYQLHTDIRLQGNENDNKLDEIKKDVFQNDFMYINKLVTALSYVDFEGKELLRPTIYKTKEALIEDFLANYHFNREDK